MVELADTPDLGSGSQECRFKSCYPHGKSPCKWDFLFFVLHFVLHNI